MQVSGIHIDSAYGCPHITMAEYLQERPYNPESLKYLLSGYLRKSVVTPDPE